MASGSFNLTRTGNTSQYVDFSVNWHSTSNGSDANSSDVHVAVYVTKSSASTSNTWGTVNTSVSVGSETKEENGLSLNVAPNGSQLIFAKTFTKKHNDDGTKQTTITVNVGGDVVWGNGNQTITLDTIPRYSKVTSFEVAELYKDGAIFHFTTDKPIDFANYSLDGKGYAILPTSGDGNPYIGTLIGVLKAGTTYKIKIQVRNRDSWLMSESETITFTTLTDKKIRLKKDSIWKETLPHIKIDGVWKEAKPYIKVNGVWKEGV